MAKRFEDLKPGDEVYSRGRWDAQEIVEPTRAILLRWREPGEVGVFELYPKPKKPLFEGYEEDEPFTLALGKARVFITIQGALEHFRKILYGANAFHTKRVGMIQGKLREVVEALEKLKERADVRCDDSEQPGDDDGGAA